LSLVANGPVGADILDYLRRDIAMTGLRFDYDERLLEYLKIDPRSGVVYVDLVKHDMDREDVLTEILNLLRCRYVCSERIYYHHAKVASGALISRAVELAVLGGLTRDEIAGTNDSTLLSHLRTRSYAGHPLGRPCPAEHRESPRPLRGTATLEALFRDRATRERGAPG
jgi:HD superfamily phosphohydrolase